MTKISNSGMYDLEKIKPINYYHCDDKYLLNSQFWFGWNSREAQKRSSVPLLVVKEAGLANQTPKCRSPSVHFFFPFLADTYVCFASLSDYLNADLDWKYVNDDLVLIIWPLIYAYKNSIKILTFIKIVWKFKMMYCKKYFNRHLCNMHII